MALLILFDAIQLPCFMYIWSKNGTLYGCLLSFWVIFSVPLLSRDHLESYTSDYTPHDLVGYCVVYIFMQTFMIPGTVFMSLLAGSLFGVFRGVALVVFTATAGASSCYFLSKMIGRPLVFSLWPDKCFVVSSNEIMDMIHI